MVIQPPEKLIDEIGVSLSHSMENLGDDAFILVSEIGTYSHPIDIGVKPTCVEPLIF